MESTKPCHRLFWIGTLALVTLAAACGGQATTPARPTIVLNDETQAIGIPIGEGDEFFTLRAHLFGGQNEVAVILSHMRPNDQTAWFEFAQELADEGYAVLTFDFRGYGESDGDQDFAKLDEDLSAAMQFMRRDRGKETVFLIGASMGGTTTLVVAAREDTAGVVTISAPAQFEDQDAVSVIANVMEPTLLVASEDDTQAMLSLQALLDATSQSLESEIYAGNLHGTNLFQSESEHADTIRQRIFQFLREHAGP